MSKTFETDVQTFAKFWLVPLGIGLILLFLYKALTGLIIIGISIFLALALKPLVHKVNSFFNRHFGTEKKHQTASAIMAYFIVVLVIGGIVAIVGPVLVNETSKFVQHFPETFEKNFGGWEGINNFGKNIGIDNLQGEVSSALKSLSNGIVGAFSNNLVENISGAADIAMKIVLILVLTMLFLLEGPSLMNVFWRSLGSDEKDNKSVVLARRIVDRMARVVSTYVSRQLFIAAIDGLASGLIVFFLSLFTPISASLAIPMGMITMLFYMIPMFGQFIGGILVSLILLFSSPVAAAIFVIVYVIYAQIENNVISPRIQGNALNLPAVMILIAITIGMYMFGLLGAIISVPIAGCVRVLVDEFPNIRALRR